MTIDCFLTLVSVLSNKREADWQAKEVLNSYETFLLFLVLLQACLS